MYAAEYQAAGSEPKTILWYEDGHSIGGERLRDQSLWFADRIGIDPGPFQMGQPPPEKGP